MSAILLENYIKEIISETAYSNKLLSEGRISDWFRSKFKSAYSYIYDEELVSMCAEWLEKNKLNKSKIASKRRASHISAINKQENKRASFFLVSIAILMALVINKNGLQKSEEGFNEAYNEVSVTLENSQNDNDYIDMNDVNDDHNETHGMIKTTYGTLTDLNRNEKLTLFKVFGIETEESFFELLDNSSTEMFNNMENDVFNSHIETINNLLSAGRITDKKEIDKAFMMLLYAQSSNKGNLFRKEINNAYTDLNNYQEVKETILNISSHAEKMMTQDNSDMIKEKCDKIFNRRISLFEDEIQKALDEKDDKRVENLQKVMEKLYEEYDNIPFD